MMATFTGETQDTTASGEPSLTELTLTSISSEFKELPTE
jgi:hypothetical protein